MKKITLTCLCFTLTTMFALVADYHLVQTQIVDGGSSGKALPTVFVMLMPDRARPQVFQKFDSSEMEAWLGGLARGSIVHYDANGFLERVPAAQLKSLKTFCQKHGVSFVESNVN